MTTDLVTIFKTQIGEDEANAVDARELWKKLESKRRFIDWTKSHIVKNLYFEKGKDWVLFHAGVKKSKGRPQKNYAIKLDMAKKISMMTDTKQGNKIRDYFLDCENKAKEAYKSLNNQEKIKEIKAKLRQLSGCLSKLERHEFNNQIRVLTGLKPAQFKPPKLNRSSTIQEIAGNMGIRLKQQHISAVKVKAIEEFRRLYYPKQRLQTCIITRNGFKVDEPVFPPKDMQWIEKYIAQQSRIQEKYLRVV